MDLAEQLASALGADEVAELGGGYQSRVFRVVDRDGRVTIAKALDASMVDWGELDARIDAIEALAEIDPRVCRPLPIGGARIAEVTSADGRLHHVARIEHAPGLAPDPADAADAELMGITLARLHISMRQLPRAALPLVGALRTVVADELLDGGAMQLLHGDFNAGNLRIADGAVKVFDLDDCGYGPPEFDVANALYMVVFDAFTLGARDMCDTFRRSFVGGYRAASGAPLDDRVLDGFIGMRIRALRTWLDDLPRAPIGIRTASPEWHRTLRSFVNEPRPPAS